MTHRTKRNKQQAMEESLFSPTEHIESVLARAWNVSEVTYIELKIFSEFFVEKVRCHLERT